MEVDVITVKFAITCGLALGLIIVALIGCHRIDKYIEQMQEQSEKEKSNE